jgi:hypothetical protein
MTERTITKEEIDKIPKVCKIGEVFRGATGWTLGIPCISAAKVVCLRDPALPSQGKGFCPDPDCPMAIFPSGTIVEKK